MASTGFTVKAADIAKTTTMEITISGMRTFTFRLWIATKLIQLAAMVMPVNTSVTIDGPEAV